jgi:hypothetical protein
MECNDSGEFYAESAALISLNAVDFERGPFGSPPVTPPTVNNVVEMQNVNTVEILGCNFLKLSSATRAFLLAGVGPLRHGGNRFEGWGANGVYRISENCSGVVKVSPNNIVGSLGWEEDYSR